MIISGKKEGRNSRRERRTSRGINTRSLVYRQIFFGFGMSLVFFLSWGC